MRNVPTDPGNLLVCICLYIYSIMIQVPGQWTENVVRKNDQDLSERTYLKYIG